MVEGKMPGSYEKGLRAELLEIGRALDLDVLHCENPSASDPGFARPFSAIEKYVFLWTAYCRFTHRTEFFSAAHEAWCQQLTDCVSNKVRELRARALLLDVTTTATYVPAMVLVLEDEEESEDIS